MMKIPHAWYSMNRMSLALPKQASTIPLVFFREFLVN
jgi:hypothetical protein